MLQMSFIIQILFRISQKCLHYSQSNFYSFYAAFSSIIRYN